jgi:hypothetical protein
MHFKEFFLIQIVFPILLNQSFPLKFMKFSKLFWLRSIGKTICIKKNTLKFVKCSQKNLMRKLGACKLATYCESIDTHYFLSFLRRSQIFELCVDRLVEICMGGTLRMSNFKILSMRCIKLAQNNPEAKISAFYLLRGRL